MVDFVSLLGVKGGPAIRPGSNMPTSTLIHISGKNFLVDAGLGVSRSICNQGCLLYTSPSPRDATLSRMPSSA